MMASVSTGQSNNRQTAMVERKTNSAGNNSARPSYNVEMPVKKLKTIRALPHKMKQLTQGD